MQEKANVDAKAAYFKKNGGEVVVSVLVFTVFSSCISVFTGPFK